MKNAVMSVLGFLFGVYVLFLPVFLGLDVPVWAKLIECIPLATYLFWFARYGRGLLRQISIVALAGGFISLIFIDSYAVWDSLYALFIMTFILPFLARFLNKTSLKNLSAKIPTKVLCVECSRDTPVEKKHEYADLDGVICEAKCFACKEDISNTYLKNWWTGEWEISSWG